MSDNRIHIVPEWDMPSYNKTHKKLKRQLNIDLQDKFSWSHEDKTLVARRIEIDRKIAMLTKERKEILDTLKKRETLRNQNKLREVKLYALKLEDDCWYVGMSYDPEKRLQKHLSGKGALWTKTHKPIKVIEIRNTGKFIQDEAASLEDDMTLEYALKYGSQYVRGGGYCQAKPRWPDIIKSNEYIF